MIKQLKIFGIIITLIVCLIWHKQATLFEVKINKTIDLIRSNVGLVLQSSDIKIHKYLFKVEIRKPQIEINSQSIEELQLSRKITDNEFLHSLLERLKLYVVDHGLSYRLADKLVISFNPLMRQLIITPVGEGELSLYSSDEKITFLLLTAKDSNPHKLTISLSQPWWLYTIRQIFVSNNPVGEFASESGSKLTGELFRVSGSCRNLQIVEALTRAPIYTQGQGSFDFAIGKELKQDKPYYYLRIANQNNNAQFHENLPNDSLIKSNKIFEFYKMHGKVNKNYEYKIAVQQTEFESLIDRIFSQNNGELNSSKLMDLLLILKSIPSFSCQAKSCFGNQHTDTTTNYNFDYQPALKSLKGNLEYTIKASSNWLSYLTQAMQFYRDLWFVVKPNIALPGEFINFNLDNLSKFLLPFAAGGELKTLLSLNLTNLDLDKQSIFDRVQGQIKSDIFTNNGGIKIQTNFLQPNLINITIILNNYKQVIDGFCNYLLEITNNKDLSQKNRLLVNSLSEYLYNIITSVSILGDELNTGNRQINITYNHQNSELEIAGNKIDLGKVALSRFFGEVIWQHIINNCFG